MTSTRLTRVGLMMGGLLAAPIVLAQVLPSKMPPAGGLPPVPTAAAGPGAASSTKLGPVAPAPSASPGAGAAAPGSPAAAGASTAPEGAVPSEPSPAPEESPATAAPAEGGLTSAAPEPVGGAPSARPLTETEIRVEEFRRRAEVGRDIRKRDARPKILAIRDLILIGHRAYNARYYDEARDALERARSATQDLVDKWHGFLDELTTDASEEIRLKPWFTQVSAEVLGEVLTLRGMLRDMYPVLADVHVAKGLFQQAIDELNLAVQLDPSDPALWLRLARAQQKKEEYDASIAAFFQSVRLDPWQPLAYYDLCKSYAKKGDVKTALVYLRRSISLGYNRFDEIALDDDLAALHGDPEFEEMVYIGPSKPY